MDVETSIAEAAAVARALPLDVFSPRPAPLSPLSPCHHCVQQDPQDDSSQLIKAAREIAESMPVTAQAARDIASPAGADRYVTDFVADARRLVPHYSRLGDACSGCRVQ